MKMTRTMMKMTRMMTTKIKKKPLEDIETGLIVMICYFILRVYVGQVPLFIVPIAEYNNDLLLKVSEV